MSTEGLARLFQSPCGVLGVCRALDGCGVGGIAPIQFQSPCGVLGVCRSTSCFSPPSTRMFQSPCGVLGVCRQLTEYGRALLWDVSVPLRGFRGLQGGPHRFQSGDRKRVSVPLRGFRGLQGEIANA